jgi:hypothetical protein
MRGFVIMAQNTTDTDYISCATQLEKSIKRVMPNENVTIITSDMLPYGDLAPNSSWKLINDWQVYDASPYEYTIKLEADMVIPTDISYLFDILNDRDICLCTTIRDYKGNISDSRVYRKFIDDNQLPDVYNAITYFKKSIVAEQFFNIVRDVFENWNEYKNILICNIDEQVTTDWAYAIASHIVGTEKTIIPNLTQLSMVHMKQFINNLSTEDWTNELVYELSDIFKIQTFPQLYPVHYHIKSFANVLGQHYG